MFWKLNLKNTPDHCDLLLFKDRCSEYLHGNEYWPFSDVGSKTAFLLFPPGNQLTYRPTLYSTTLLWKGVAILYICPPPFEGGGMASLPPPVPTSLPFTYLIARGYLGLPIKAIVIESVVELELKLFPLRPIWRPDVSWENPIVCCPGLLTSRGGSRLRWNCTTIIEIGLCPTKPMMYVRPTTNMGWYLHRYAYFCNGYPSDDDDNKRSN